MTSIGGGAFANCDELTDVTFNSIPKVGSSVFDYCDNLSTKTLALTDDSYVAADKGEFPTLTAEPIYTRSIAATSNWGTLVLPFEAKSDDKVQLYQLSAVANSTMTFSPVETVAANTPCVFMKKMANATSVTFTANSAAVANAVAAEPAAVDGYAIRGTYAKKENQTGIYFIARNKFYHADDPITIAPYRAWFESESTTTGAKSFEIVIDEDGMTTSIGSMNNGQLTVNDAAMKFFDKGRVIIVKNGKKYNTNGQEIK